MDAAMLHYPEVLSAAECEVVIEASRAHTRPYPRPGGELLAAPVDDPDDRLGADIPGRLCQLFAAANEQLGWGIPLDIVRYGVSCYQVGGFMAAHVDDEERDPAGAWSYPHRGISASVPLSEPGGYEGGQLRTEAGTVPPLGRGDAVLFGSSLEHEVLPVTAGQRWVLLAWAYCNHIRRRIL